MTQKAASRLNPILQWICAVPALWALACFILVAASSLTYPFHLEWMEGHVMDGVARVRQGLPLYARPSLEYISFLYTPYYYYLAALVSLVTGLDFVAGRLVSFVAALATGVIIYKWLRRENCPHASAITGAGAYYATYIVTGRWMDTARVDSLFVCLTLWALYLFYYQRGKQQSIVAACVMAAAYFTKQTAMIAMLPAIMVMALIDWRHAARTTSIYIAIVLLFSVTGHYLSGGWYTFYTYELPSMHKLQQQQLIPFWTRDLLPNVGIMMCICALFILAELKQNWKSGLWYGALAAGFVGCSYSGRLNWGGFINVLMPACCILGMLSGLALGRAAQQGRAWVLLLAGVLMLTQFVQLRYNPYRYIPTEASVQEGQRFLAELSKINGEVFMPEVQFVQRRIGKVSYGLNMGALDIIVTDMKDKNYIKQDLLADIKNAVEHQAFGAIMPGGVVPVPGLARYYRYEKSLIYPKEYISQSANFLRRELYVPLKP